MSRSVVVGAWLMVAVSVFLPLAGCSGSGWKREETKSEMSNDSALTFSRVAIRGDVPEKSELRIKLGPDGYLDNLVKLGKEPMPKFSVFAGQTRPMFLLRIRFDEATPVDGVALQGPNKDWSFMIYTLKNNSPTPLQILTMRRETLAAIVGAKELKIEYQGGSEKGLVVFDVRGLKSEFTSLCEKSSPYCKSTGATPAVAEAAPVEAAPAVDPLVTGCNANEMKACDALVDKLIGGAPTDPAAIQRSLVTREKACNGGIGRHCLALAHYYSTGLGVAKDLMKSAEFEAKACEAPNFDPVVCGSVAAKFSSAAAQFGITANIPRAKIYYRRSCEATRGVGNDCASLGFILEKEGTEQALTEAEKLYQKSCDGANPMSCYFLAGFYFEAPDPFRNLERGMVVAKKACADGSVEACAQLKIAPTPSAPTKHFVDLPNGKFTGKSSEWKKAGETAAAWCREHADRCPLDQVNDLLRQGGDGTLDVPTSPSQKNQARLTSCTQDCVDGQMLTVDYVLNGAWQIVKVTSQPIF